jgi:hypothetical protein
MRDFPEKYFSVSKLATLFKHQFERTYEYFRIGKREESCISLWEMGCLVGRWVAIVLLIWGDKENMPKVFHRTWRIRQKY